MSKFKYVKFDETRFFNPDVTDLLGPESKIWVVYAFDSEEQTHCCELTPSYWLEYIGFEIVYDESVSQENRDYAEELVRNWYNLDDNSAYYHCCGIDKIAKDIPTKNDLETMDDVREQFHANPWMI